MKDAGRAAALARHDLLIIEPESWIEVVSRVDTASMRPDTAALIAQWGRSGWPVIVRRSSARDGDTAVPVGLPLPPSLGKQRIALSLRPEVPWRLRPPLELAEAREGLPRPWRPVATALEALGRSLDLRPRVFGAALWQTLTGLSYLTPTSDLDVLWPVRDPATLPALLDGLARIDAAGPVRIDGEVRTPSGDVAWRELHAARQGGLVLVKGKAKVGLVAPDRLFARGRQPCC